MKDSFLGVASLLLVLFLFVGEVKCIIKMFRCNWEPIGKAEVVYTVAACTALGSVVGWFDIKDK